MIVRTRQYIGLMFLTVLLPAHPGCPGRLVCCQLTPRFVLEDRSAASSPPGLSWKTGLLPANPAAHPGCPGRWVCCQLNRVVLDKRPLNGCRCVPVITNSCFLYQRTIDFSFEPTSSSSRMHYQSINQTRQFLTRRNTAKPLQGRNRTRPPRPTL